MKKIFFILMIVVFPYNVLAEEIQLTDYSYVYAKRMLNGYAAIAYSDKYEAKISNEINDFWNFDRIENNILKRDGTLLYNPTDYDNYYYIHKQECAYNFPQSVDNHFKVYTYTAPYKDNGVFEKKPTILNENGEIDNSVDFDTVYWVQFFSDNICVYTENDNIKVNMITEESESEKVDKSYIFKEKEINGVKYYALFKELKGSETATDFIPTERPAEQYAKNIEKMAADKLLYNNELCFFDRGITKLDFGIVLGRAYCKAIDYNIDNFTSGTHFVDVNHPYCLFLADKGILGSDNDLYINEKTISQSTVLSALNKIAADNHILTEWSKVKEIQNTEEECSRELAYSEIYKLYELLQNSDTPKDIGAMSGIYIITGSLFILSVGALLNDKSKRKIKNQPVYGSKESLI